VSPWWMGLTVDHLYEACPTRLRSLPELERYGWATVGRDGLDPDGTDVCGWCVRVWRAQQRSHSGAGS
jgi:hypothetical protein